MTDHPELGFEPHFLEKLALGNGIAARLLSERGIKVVHDGGALNSQGLSDKVQDYLHSQEISNSEVA